MRYHADRKLEKRRTVPEVTFDALGRGPALYAPTEVARLVRVHPRTVLNWIRHGRLDAIQLSARIYRIPRAAVVRQLFPERVTRLRVRRQGRVPTPGKGERLATRSRAKVPA